MSSPARTIRHYQNAAGQRFEVFTGDNGLLTIARAGEWRRTPITESELAAHYTAVEPPAYKLVQIDADWLPEGHTVAAYSNGARWNGWALPYFSAEADRSLLDHMPELRFDAARDAYILKGDDGDEEDVFEACTIDVDGQPVKTYPIGTGSWTWEFAEPASQQPAA